jgi:hypothetical protein
MPSLVLKTIRQPARGSWRARLRGAQLATSRKRKKSPSELVAAEVHVSRWERATVAAVVYSKELTMASSVMCFILGAIAPLATVGWMIMSTS